VFKAIFESSQKSNPAKSILHIEWAWAIPKSKHYRKSLSFREPSALVSIFLTAAKTNKYFAVSFLWPTATCYFAESGSRQRCILPWAFFLAHGKLELKFWRIKLMQIKKSITKFHYLSRFIRVISLFDIVEIILFNNSISLI
jgi:hypothetical protein